MNLVLVLVLIAVVSFIAPAWTGSHQIGYHLNMTFHYNLPDDHSPCD